MLKLIVEALGRLLVALIQQLLTKPTPNVEPVWLRKARMHLGFHETGVNRGIERFIELAKCGSLGDPWCMIFVNAMLELCGIRGTRSPAARSPEKSEHFIELDEPAVGCIVVMWRGDPNGWQGHVFFYTGHDPQGRVWGIGANESDEVRLVPHDPSRVVGYFWPKSIPLPKVGRVRVNGAGQIATKEV